MKTRILLSTVLLVVLLSSLILPAMAQGPDVDAVVPVPEKAPPEGKGLPEYPGLPHQAGIAGVATDYTWSQATGTYTEITGGAVLTTLCDDQNYVANAIPFTFTFNGTDYTQFSLNCNGFIAMGATVSSTYTPISATANSDVIAALGGDLQTNTTGGEIRFERLGTAPNQVLVIQWKNFRHYGATGDLYNFQIRLYETSNLVEVVYGAFTQNATARTSQVGIRGTTNADFNSRTGTAEWINSSPSTLNTNTMALTSTYFPPSGLTWDWSAVVGPNLSLSTKAAPGKVVFGEPIEYTIEILNTGLAPALEATLVDPIPAGTVYNGDVACSSGSCSFDGTNVVWNGQVAAQPKALSGQARVVEASRSVELKLEAVGGSSVETNPPVVNAPVSLVLDDGSRENDIGLGGTIEMLWVNRFTPDPADFPFDLTEVQVYFSSIGLVNVGDEMVLIMYENTTGNNDPAVGSNFLASFAVTVQALDAWNVYTLPTPVTFAGPGDAVIGVIGMETPGFSYWPASMDQTATQARSWAGWWNTSPPPIPPLLPPPNWTLIDAYFAGNWMVRGYGETSEQPPENPVTVTFSVTPENPECGMVVVNEATINDPQIPDPVVVQAATEVWEVVLLHEDFEGDIFPPTGWYETHEAAGMAWTDQDLEPRGNLTGGTGKFAIVDDDYGGSVALTTAQLWTPPFDIPGGGYATQLLFKTDYNNISASEQANVDISLDSGATWNNVLSWNGDHRGPLTQSVDLTAFAGATGAILRFYYYDGAAYAWWWEIDDVQVVSCYEAAPEIDVSPLELSQTLCPDEQATQELTICNLGDADLTWELSEVVPAKGVQAVLYDNGPLVTHPAACSGMDASRLQDPLGLTIYGFGNQVSAGNHMADDFVVTDPAGWDVQQITFFAYQTGAPTSPSPITGVYYQIWNGPPNDPGSSVVFGDLVTNRLLSSASPNMQRDWDSSMCANNRYIFADVTNAGVVLAPGTYWLDWMTDGSTAYSGPWAPPITILGQATTGNGMQYTPAGGWLAALDGTFQQGLPFVIEGEIAGPPADLPWLSESPITGTLPSGECQVVDVTFDATGLAPGTYSGALDIDSNDADEPTITVPVALTVEECGADTVHIGNITFVQTMDPYGRAVVRWYVMTHDANHGPLGEVTVDASIWSPGGGPFLRTRISRLTGWARFHWGYANPGAFLLCVDNLSKPGYSYVPGDNDVPNCAP